MLTDYQGKRAVALVSGGLDSVVSLAQAAAVMDVRLVIFFDYGQRAVDRERNAVLGVVNYYDHPLREGRLALRSAPTCHRSLSFRRACKHCRSTAEFRS